MTVYHRQAQTEDFYMSQTYMLLLKQASIDLTLEGLNLTSQLVVILFCPMTLVIELASQIVCLVPQLVEGLLVLPGGSADLVFSLPELKIKLCARV